MTVGIKEISQIIRKSESSGGVSEPSSTSSSASSSSSGSGLGLPIAPPDVALVRRLDGLGSMITHDVISKVPTYSAALQSSNVVLTLSEHAAHFFLQVCQSMLQTAYLELEENSTAVGRKRDSPSEDFDQATKFKRLKVNQSENPTGQEGADCHTVEGDDTAEPSNEGSDIACFAGHQSKMIVTKLLHAFGSSLLGAVRSSPSHTEVDMSLGIAGLHSMKTEKDKTVKDTSTISNELNGHAQSTAIVFSEVEQNEEVIKTHPFSVSYGETPVSESKQFESGVVAATSPSMRSSTYVAVSENKQLTHSSRSMSVTSSTTTEEQLSQERTEDLSDSSRDDKDAADTLNNSITQSDVSGASPSHQGVATHIHGMLKSPTRTVIDLSLSAKKGGAENEIMKSKIRCDADVRTPGELAHNISEQCSSNIDEQSSPRHFETITTAIEQIAEIVPENLITTAIHD